MAFDNNMQRKCGFCGESIPANTGRCPYCGSILEISFGSDYNIEPQAANQDDNTLRTENESGIGSSQSSVNDRYSGNIPGNAPEYMRGNVPVNPLSNGMKVFLTIIFALVPGIGQLAGIITAIIFMNSEGDSDRKSFGVAILVASLVMFVLSCIGCFIAVLAISSSQYAF